MGEAMFREIQRFRQTWMWLILLSIAAIGWWALVQQLVFGVPFGDNPASDMGVLIIFISCGVLLPGFMAVLGLETVVDTEGIGYRFVPVQRMRRIEFSEIASYRVRRYSPLREYGGWGIRYGAGGKAYNVSGDMGLDIELRKGGRILIGTNRPEEMENLMRLLVGESGAAQI
jgi:hypothetical protein